MITRAGVKLALAEEISNVIREIRLIRIFGASEEFGEGTPFKELPKEDRDNWLDVSEAVLRISEKSRP